MKKSEIIQLTSQAALEHAIPERVGLGLIWAESKFVPDSYRHTSPEDHSIGLGQQTFRWSEFWQGTYDDPDALSAWKQAYSDPDYALEKAMSQLSGLWQPGDDDLFWMCRYNKRSGIVAPGVRQNYQDGLDWADKYLEERGEMDTGFEFTGGFADKAHELQENGVDPGTPLTGEEQWGSATVQVTTTGMMVYVSPGQPNFFAAVWG